MRNFRIELDSRRKWSCDAALDTSRHPLVRINVAPGCGDNEHSAAPVLARFVIEDKIAKPVVDECGVKSSPTLEVMCVRSDDHVGTGIGEYLRDFLLAR